MSAEPSLAELQARFYALVTAPSGVASGLAEHGLSEAELAAIIVGDERLSAVERLDIYANMYFFRILDVLRSEYAKVLALVGDTAFHNLITDYLIACPPTHFSIRNAGVELPRFLAGHALAGEQPWLPALARLERARIDLFDAADAEVLTLDRLRALDPDQFAALPLRLIPAHLLLEVEFAVDEPWLAIENEGTPEPVEAAPRTLLVWRQELSVFHRAADADERALLPLLTAGAPFGLVCERLSDGRAPEAATRAAFELLARWTGDGLLVAP